MFEVLPSQVVINIEIINEVCYSYLLYYIFKIGCVFALIAPLSMNEPHPKNSRAVCGQWLLYRTDGSGTVSSRKVQASWHRKNSD